MTCDSTSCCRRHLLGNLEVASRRPSNLNSNGGRLTPPGRFPAQRLWYLHTLLQAAKKQSTSRCCAELALCKYPSCTVDVRRVVLAWDLVESISDESLIAELPSKKLMMCSEDKRQST